MCSSDLDGSGYTSCGTTSPTTVSLSGLADGSHTLTVRAVDAVGNVSTTTFYSWTVDTSVPVVTLTSPANGAYTSSQTPTFAGVAGRVSGDASTITINIYAGSSATGTAVQTRSATRNADGTYSVAALTLAEGRYTAQAVQDDAAGNEIGRAHV